MKNSLSVQFVFFTVSLTLISAVLAGNPDRQKNIDLVKLFFEEGHNKHNLEIADQIISDSFIKYNNGDRVDNSGPQVLKDIIKRHIKNNSDFRFDVLEIISENEKVVVKWQFNGTNVTQGKPIKISVDGLSIFYIKHNKIEKLWQVFDFYNFYKTLGYEIIPPNNMP